MCSQEHQQMKLQKMYEKNAEKPSISSAKTCQNYGRVFKNHTFQVFRKGLRNDPQRPPFGVPPGLQNPEKPPPGGYPKTLEKWRPPKAASGSKRGPRQGGVVLLALLDSFSGPSPRSAPRSLQGWIWKDLGTILEGFSSLFRGISNAFFRCRCHAKC